MKILYRAVNTAVKVQFAVMDGIHVQWQHGAIGVATEQKQAAPRTDDVDGLGSHLNVGRRNDDAVERLPEEKPEQETT